MPLSEPPEREHIHTRDISCRGFRREDGLWDIEGRLVDTKRYAFDNRFRGEVAAGAPVHEMWLRITVDDALEIKDIEAVTEPGHHPFATCAEITPDYRKMVGTKIRPGWTRTVRERLGAERGCTHQTRLLQEIAVVAIQTVYPVLSRERNLDSGDRRPPHIDTCHALRADGEVVREMYPRWYRD
jgi:hypothetical protein